MTLLTPDILAWVGTSIAFTSDPISLAEARRFVAGSGDDHPDYPSTDASDGAHDGPVPPMLYYGATRPFADQAALAEDGTVTEHRPFIGSGQTMGGSVEVEWRRPLRIGDRLRGVRTLAALDEKQGKSRSFVVALWITEYFDAQDDLVVCERYEQILF